MAANKLKRALISVSDKTGVVELAQTLRAFKVEIVSTGGTAKLLQDAGIKVVEISDFTGFPEILDGRVKTLHPKVHGGILANRSKKAHAQQAKRLGIKDIDMVVVNLYPFEKTAAKAKVTLPALIEQIDIGGVALIRSAAKNSDSVAIVSRVDQYGAVVAELEKNKGSLTAKTRQRLAVEAFAESAYYDTVIYQTLLEKTGQASTSPRWIQAATQKQTLRYGENPHQAATWYASSLSDGLAKAEQLHGKELSFNNLLDLESALQMVHAFRKPSAVVVKHNNPCGIACADTIKKAFEKAHACDPISAFGGIVGLNRKVDVTTAKALQKAGFLECIIAPDFAKGALEILTKKKNVRLLKLPGLQSRKGAGQQFKQVAGGVLVQDTDSKTKPFSHWKLATSKKPTAAQRRDLEFAWTVAKYVRSNAIVVAKDEKTIGIGVGQTSRVDSAKIALKAAGKAAKGAVLASDGFFPKPDGPESAVKAGIAAIVQPGGSIQDPAVIAVAKKAGIPMLLTGQRHFKH